MEDGTKRLRRLTAVHAEVSLQLMEESYSLASAGTSSPKNQGAIMGTPVDPEPQNDARKRTVNKRKRASG